MSENVKPGTTEWRKLSYAERASRRAKQDRVVKDSAYQLLEMLEIMVEVFNVKDIDPLMAFTAIEKAKGVIAKVGGEVQR